MNVSAAAPQSPPTPLRSESKAPASPQRDTSSAAEPRDAFQRALHAKERRDQGDESEDTPADDAAAALAAAALLATPHLARATPPAAGPVSAALDTQPNGTRAALEAALNSNAGPVVSPVGGTDPAAIWEASISEPDSIAVDVRATRAERSTAQQAQPSWTVAVSSSTVNADVLARHAPRLNERLRKQGVGFSHVRIERKEDDAE